MDAAPDSLGHDADTRTLLYLDFTRMKGCHRHHLILEEAARRRFTCGSVHFGHSGRSVDFETDAVGLRHLSLFPGPVVGAAVSGLPFRLISPRKTLAILEGVFANLRPGGALYQFTLGRRCPFDQSLLDRLDLEVTRVGHTFRNFPPATVYRVTRINTLGTYDWRFA